MAASRSTRSDRPAPVSLNLDKLEREGTVDPFVVVLGGKRYECADPRDYDYRDAVAAQQAFAAGHPGAAIEMVIPEDQREEFFANRLPAWKLEELFTLYNQHYGLPTPGEARASSAS